MSFILKKPILSCFYLAMDVQCSFTFHILLFCLQHCVVCTIVCAYTNVIGWCVYKRLDRTCTIVCVLIIYLCLDGTCTIVCILVYLCGVHIIVWMGIVRHARLFAYICLACTNLCLDGTCTIAFARCVLYYCIWAGRM